MFDFKDIPKLFLAFFVVMPIISLIHELGHMLFAGILGAKNIKVIIGSGKIIFSNRFFEIRKYYFYYGFCYFENIDEKSSFRNILIYSGGTISNCIASAILILIISKGVLEPNIFTYQFLYFSLYYVFFALFPMSYPDGNYSDGKIIYYLLAKDKGLIRQKMYQLKWHKKNNKWILYSENEEKLEEFEKYEDARKVSVERAKQNRPSKLAIIEDEHHDNNRIEIFPRNPI
ncbi:site-2 protease family protein [Zunongwangia sp.]|uniref:site-2 protease family protein n=1 Tax=Zunongwangia sp. TaxID=1965325 RepID=UPI003AA9D34C